MAISTVLVAHDEKSSSVLDALSMHMRGEIGGVQKFLAYEGPALSVHEIDRVYNATKNATIVVAGVSASLYGDDACADEEIAAVRGAQDAVIPYGFWFPQEEAIGDLVPFCSWFPEMIEAYFLFVPNKEHATDAQDYIWERDPTKLPLVLDGLISSAIEVCEGYSNVIYIIPVGDPKTLDALKKMAEALYTLGHRAPAKRR